MGSDTMLAGTDKYLKILMANPQAPGAERDTLLVHFCDGVLLYVLFCLIYVLVLICPRLGCDMARTLLDKVAPKNALVPVALSISRSVMIGFASDNVSPFPFGADLWVTEELICINAPGRHPSSLGTDSRNKRCRRDAARIYHRLLLRLQRHMQAYLRSALAFTTISPIAIAILIAEKRYWRRAPLSFPFVLARPPSVGKNFRAHTVRRFPTGVSACFVIFAELNTRTRSLMFAGPWHPNRSAMLSP